MKREGRYECYKGVEGASKGGKKGEEDGLGVLGPHSKHSVMI